MNGAQIKQVRYDSMVAQALVGEAMAELAHRYGGGDETPVAASDFEPPGGAFLVAYLDGEPVGCAGWRSFGGTGNVAELKRMYTCPSVRGRGVARTLLAAVEQAALGEGRTSMILECGDRQPEAVSLYRACGYERIEDFGHYRDEPGVISLGRDLSSPRPR